MQIQGALQQYQTARIQESRSKSTQSDSADNAINSSAAAETSNSSENFSFIGQSAMHRFQDRPYNHATGLWKKL